MTHTRIDRATKTAELRQKHQPIFDALEEPKASFIPKMVHNVKGHPELGKCAGFFESELKDLVDVYTEMVDISMESEDPDRRLFRIRSNAHFREEYAASPPNQNGDSRYFIPFDEFEEVKLNKPKLSTKREKIEELDIPNNPNVDLPMEQMTMRDYAAIHMKEPVSLKPWLNDVIKEANTKPF
jgi:hypothetical protein